MYIRNDEHEMGRRSTAYTRKSFNLDDSNDLIICDDNKFNESFSFNFPEVKQIYENCAKDPKSITKRKKTQKSEKGHLQGVDKEYCITRVDENDEVQNDCKIKNKTLNLNNVYNIKKEDNKLLGEDSNTKSENVNNQDDKLANNSQKDEIYNIDENINHKYLNKNSDEIILINETHNIINQYNEMDNEKSNIKLDDNNGKLSEAIENIETIETSNEIIKKRESTESYDSNLTEKIYIKINQEDLFDTNKSSKSYINSFVITNAYSLKYFYCLIFTIHRLRPIISLINKNM